MSDKRPILLILLAASLLLSGCVMRPQGSETVLRDSPAETTAEPEPVRYNVEFRRGDEVLSAQSVEEGSLPEVPVGAGNVRLLGWTDESGSRTDPFVPVERDAVFFADTRPLLAADSGWLLPREYGFLEPEAPFTRRDAQDALGVLLSDSADAEPVAASWSADTDKTQPLTAEEFAGLLYALFETSDADSVLSETVPPEAETVTRAQAACCLSRLLDAEPRTDLYYPDAAPDRDDYTELSAAAAPGPLDRQALLDEAVDSFLWFDGYLYRIDEEGYFLTDMEFEGLTYGPGGRYTSGNAELDSLVAKTLTELTDPAQTRRERLRAVYLHVKNDFKYLVRNYYASGEHGWEIPEALYMYENGRGNCYCYAGMFWSLARGLGYNATAYSGTMGNQNQPHAWTEIDLDGEIYICDPEIEMNYWWLAALNNDNSMYTDNFMMLRRTAGGWNYQAEGRQ